MTKNSAAVAEQHQGLISISDGIATVEIAPAAGGALASYRWRQNGSVVDWLRPADQAAIDGRDAGAMACFPLVPYSNRIRGGRFAFAGRTVELPTNSDDPHYEHGHGWRRSWTVVRHEASSTVLSYRHAADSWPWSYEARQAISLIDGRLAIALSLRNLSDTPMPAGFGLHPYFPSTPWTHVQARVSGMWETDAEILPTRHVLPPAGSNPTTGFDVSETDFDTVFTGWSRRARISWPEHGRQLDIEAEAPLDFLVLYTPPGEPFFCAEPVSNITDAFNRRADTGIETGCIVLAPGHMRSASVRFTPSREI
ncbi:aldose 1-epimerase [Mesorhizobium sp. AD1-1]|uniref:aldose 1-epimerase n=1 Tax=Mesorhizobium sp. AD1-1 TaxID=2876621 RepID=UPI001CCFCB18|nr:aldose 1-epimerase [Mesorhizobium sp. AD1-1]MBZ9718283.1 aldose 1-epimerase [Mesorhizobium sp. AD1-1]